MCGGRSLRVCVCHSANNICGEAREEARADDRRPSLARRVRREESDDCLYSAGISEFACALERRGL